MTVEDAIKRIDDILDSDVHWDESIDYKLMSIDVDWLGKSKEALEKQIPKKPLFIDGDYDLPLCSECKNVVEDNEPYCSVCGQALDWSDTE